VFKASEGPGLGDILAGTTSLEQAIQNTSNDQLKIVSAGSASSRAIPERLAGEAMSRLLLEASTRFDIILVDVPPAVVSGDGYALANKCDASVIVCRAMVEKRGLLARVRNQLGESRAEFLGVVVNAVRASAGGYFKRNIKATHAYQLNGKA
jgi:Mrp family chromosome partitioning ATPase